MTKFIIGFFLLLVVAFAGAGYYILVVMPGPVATDTRPNNSGSDPIVNFGQTGGTNTGGQQQTTETPPLEVATFAKGRLSVRNFLADPDVIKVGDRTGEEYYSLGTVPAGTHLEVLTGTTSLPTSIERGYEVMYYADGTFALALLKEPIAEVRRAARDGLVTRLGIDVSELCQILIEVRVDVPGVLAGKRIGFPGCPGATQLPGD